MKPLDKLLVVLVENNMQTIIDTDFGPVYVMADGRRAAMPARHTEQIFFLGPDKRVVSKSTEEADINAFYEAVERRGNAVAAKMKAKLMSLDHRQGSVVLSLNDEKLDVSNTWANHILGL